MKPSKKKLYEKQFLNEISTNRDDDIKKAINTAIKKLGPVEKNEMKAKLTNAGLPVAYQKETDASILNQILAIVTE